MFNNSISKIPFPSELDGLSSKIYGSKNLTDPIQSHFKIDTSISSTCNFPHLRTYQTKHLFALGYLRSGCKFAINQSELKLTELCRCFKKLTIVGIILGLAK